MRNVVAGFEDVSVGGAHVRGGGGGGGQGGGKILLGYWVLELRTFDRWPLATQNTT
jgi:hypothetical protein